VFLAEEVASAQREPRELRRFTGRGRRNAAMGFRAPGVSTPASGPALFIPVTLSLDIVGSAPKGRKGSRERNRRLRSLGASGRG
jgi:hypothetical protein